MQGEMAVMDKTGDTKIIWDAENDDEVKVARDTFDKLKTKNYIAYSVKRNGKQDTIIQKFDPGIEKMIMIPPIVGG